MKVDVRRLAELVVPERGISYGIVQPGSPVDNGVPIVRVANIRNGRIDGSNPLCVAPAIAEKYERTRLRGGELLLTLVGTVGETAVVPSELAGWNTARAVAVVPVLPGVGAQWVSYALRTTSLRRAVHSRLNTTVQATLNLRDVAQLEVPLPDKTTREGILAVLGALDEKIELNRKMNTTLEELARALFKSWFVDFDPVRAKMEGRKPYGMDAETAALFPDSFEDSELGPIPKGWQVRSLDRIADFRNGLALQKYPPSGDEYLPVIKIREMRTGFDDRSNRASVEIEPKWIVEDGDILFSWSGSLIAKQWAGGRGALNQHLFKVTSSEFPKWFYFGWVLEHLPEFQAIAADKATTMGHIKRHHLKDAKVVVPPEDTLASLDQVARPLLERQLSSELESRTLAELRDTLLPKLISGELRVPASLDLGAVPEAS